MAGTDDLAAALQYGPRTATALRRSQYLDQAINSIGQSAQAPRSWGETGAKLLAQALLLRSRSKNEGGLSAALLGDQNDAIAPTMSSLDHMIIGGSPAGSPTPTPTGQISNGTPNPPPPAAPVSAPSNAGTSPLMAALGAPPQGQGGASWMTPNVVKAIAGEAEGEGPDGMARVAAVILKRAQETGMSPDQVVTAPHQFEGLKSPRVAGLQPGTPRYDRIVAAVQGASPGQFDSFYSPGAQSALGRSAPAWDDGSGKDLGHHRFFSLGYAGPPGWHSPGAQPMDAPPPAAPVGPQGSGLPAPPTGQVGPPPIVGGVGAGGAPPIPSGAPPASMAGVALGMPMIHGVTREQVEAVKAALQSPNPHVRQIAMQQAMALQQHAAAAEEMETKIDPTTGQIYQASKTRPGVAFTTTIPGARGALPAGMEYGPDGVAHVVQGTQKSAPHGIPGAVGVFQAGPDGTETKIGDPTVRGAPFRIQGAPGLYVTGPNGAPQKIAEDEYGPAQIGELRNTVLKSKEHEDLAEALSAWRSMTAASEKGGGMPAYAMRDTFARLINPGAVARVGTLQAIKEAQGIPDNVKGMLLNLQGDGDLDPRIRQQILDVSRDFLASRYSALQTINQANADYAKRHGVNPADVTVDMGPAPGRFLIPELRPRQAAQAEPQQPAAHHAAQPRAAAQQPHQGPAPAPPAINAIVGGYKYLGGPPGDPHSWARAQ